MVWGVIIYSARLFSDASTLPRWARPVLDGLLGLNIDLAMDALAIRLGMWDWGAGLESQYFGVPYANFWAWFRVVFSFSMGLRLLSSNMNWLGRWLAPLGAIIIGVLGVLATNALISFVIAREWRMSAIILILSAALLCVLSLRPRFYQQPMPSLIFWVPFAFHLYFLLAGLSSGTIFEPTVLLLVSLVMMILSLYFHRKTVRGILSS